MLVKNGVYILPKLKFLTYSSGFAMIIACIFQLCFGKEENVKKIVCVIALLCLANLSSAAVILTCQDLGNHTVGLYYDSSHESSLVRAFAMIVTLNKGVITGVGNYYQGQGPGYGIYPATIIINPVDGEVTSWGSPIANSGDPGAVGGIGHNSITLEFGSLYVDASQAPPEIGRLCTFTVSEDCSVSLCEEETFRGGVVLENGNPANTLCYGCNVVPEPATMILVGLGIALIRKKR